MLINFWKNIRRMVNNMEKKYELIPSDKEGLYRVKALKDFNDVKNGDIGGYVESENNLSQYDDCWIYDNAVVRDNAVVVGNAQIWGNAEVCDNAQVCDNAVVWNNAQIYGYAKVCGDAHVYGNAYLHDNAKVCGDAQIWGNADVSGDTEVCGNAQIWGNADVSGDAIISSDKDYIVFKNWWSSGRYFTWTRSNNMWKVGCFYGTGEELIAKAYKDSKEKGREYENIVRYVEIVNNF